MAITASTFWSNATTNPSSSYAGLSTAQIIATTTPDVFAAWSVAAQYELVTDNGTGTPAALIVGPPGNQVLATVNSDQTLTQSLVPTGYGGQPVGLTFAQFSQWSPDLQSYYLQQHFPAPTLAAATAYSPITMGYGSNAFSFTVNSDGSAAFTSATLTTVNAQGSSTDAAATDAATLATAPSALSASAFFAMTGADQFAYFKNNAAQNASTLGIGGMTSDNVVAGTAIEVPITFNGQSYSLYVPAMYGFTAFNTNLSLSAFKALPPAIQEAYMRRTSKTVFPEVGYFSDPQPNGSSAVILKAGGAITIATNPAGFDMTSGFPNVASTVLPAEFLGWPLTCQIAVLSAFPHNKHIGTAASGTITVSLAGSPASVHASAVADFHISPSTLDPSVFALWSEADQTSYFFSNSSGGSPLTLGNPIPVVTQAGRPATQQASLRAAKATLLSYSNSALIAQAYPSDFSTTPGTLNPALFLSWPAAFRAVYLAANQTLDPVTQNPLPLMIGGQIIVSQASDGTISITTSQLAPTLGQNATTIPYDHLPGSAVGVTSVINRSTATLLFPNFDGTSIATTTTPLPDGFSTNPQHLSPATFGAWTSSQQLSYIRTNIGTASSLKIGAGLDPASAIDVFMSAPVSPQLTVPKVYIAQNIQKADIAKMALADQITLANIPAFQTIAKSLGLIPDGQLATSAAAALTYLNDPTVGIIAKARAVITNPTGQNPPLLGLSTPPSLSPADQKAYDADKKVFTDEIDLLQNQLAGTAIFSTADIQNKLTAITGRFTRAYAFAQTVYGTGVTTDSSNVPNIPTVPNKDQISNGYNIFMSQERTILDLANRADSLAKAGAQAGTQQQLDVPNLVFLFMLYANLTGEAIIRADTEEVNQTNILLTLYSKMQAIINQTVGSYGSDQTQSRYISGSGPVDKDGYHVLTSDEQNTLKAFTLDYVEVTPAVVSVKHIFAASPMELLKNFTRPTDDYSVSPTTDSSGKFVGYIGRNAKLSAHWTGNNTNLSDKVTLINQGSQLKMNDINSETKQKDREFDLANNALSKMSDIIQQIGNTIN